MSGTLYVEGVRMTRVLWNDSPDFGVVGARFYWDARMKTHRAIRGFDQVTPVVNVR